MGLRERTYFVITSRMIKFPGPFCLWPDLRDLGALLALLRLLRRVSRISRLSKHAVVRWIFARGSPEAKCNIILPPGRYLTQKFQVCAQHGDNCIVLKPFETYCVLTPNRTAEFC